MEKRFKYSFITQCFDMLRRFLFTIGERATHLYVIYKGSVKVWTTDPQHHTTAVGEELSAVAEEVAEEIDKYVLNKSLTKSMHTLKKIEEILDTECVLGDQEFFEDIPRVGTAMIHHTSLICTISFEKFTEIINSKLIYCPDVLHRGEIQSVYSQYVFNKVTGNVFKLLR